jgi:hypothetical protein
LGIREGRDLVHGFVICQQLICVGSIGIHRYCLPDLATYIWKRDYHKISPFCGRQPQDEITLVKSASAVFSTCRGFGLLIFYLKHGCWLFELKYFIGRSRIRTCIDIL